MDGYNRKQELETLVELCRELVRLGVKPGLSDARPALSVRTELSHRKVWVEVDALRGAFVWRRDDHERHPLDDPAGAAARLAEYMKRRDEAGPGEQS
ncbi:hypothetical protein NE235_36405 [Actinoallomurus spadix]|uniref:Uncharacterized protein n=1 Tax=Actinoallomurus spadix TaxID=79912 RepID=A0ABP3GM31_9ACTN|nr:hypothetical protein [Actinoallomurus spadix]MCO5991612.1 hypothetical protein [Actinoallomurus spadix]